MELPEKQGLKPLMYSFKNVDVIGCSGTSRKTRIETISSRNSGVTPLIVAVELPEKQGLKH